METQLKIKQLWTAEYTDGKRSIFVLTPDDSLIEFTGIKVIETKDSIELQTDVNDYSSDGGVTCNMEISKPKLSTKKQVQDATNSARGLLKKTKKK